MFVVRLSAWVPPGVRVKFLAREEGMSGVYGGKGVLDRKRMRWSREGRGAGSIVSE